MKAVQLLRQQLQAAHEEMTMADVTEDVAHFSDIGKANPVGAAYAHSVMAEDMIISQMLAHTESLALHGETGLSEQMPSMAEWDKHEAWVRSVRVNLPKLREFAQSVYQASDAYLASLTDEDLDVEMERPMVGKHNLAWFINNFVILHIANLTGEISAAKGVQGLKGYPF